MSLLKARRELDPCYETRDLNRTPRPTGKEAQIGTIEIYECDTCYSIRPLLYNQMLSYEYNCKNALILLATRIY